MRAAHTGRYGPLETPTVSTVAGQVRGSRDGRQVAAFVIGEMNEEQLTVVLEMPPSCSRSLGTRTASWLRLADCGRGSGVFYGRKTGGGPVLARRGAVRRAWCGWGVVAG